MPPSKKSVLGQLGEAAAERFLINKGYKIMEKNFRIRGGEIDLIADDKGIIVFIEVKTREGVSHGHPEEAVNWRKQAQMSKVAVHFIKQRELGGRQCRFDVIALSVKPLAKTAKVLHFINAFEMPERY